MPERTPKDSNISKIVAKAMKVTASALANWLGLTIDTDEAVTKPSLEEPNKVMCCCRMSVDVAIGSPKLNDTSTQQTRAAGQLLFAWQAKEAAWMIDQSLSRVGTSVDPSTWGELEKSAISETSNVVGCEFLNAIAEGIHDISQTEVSLMPDSPYIEHAYAGGWMDAAIIEVEGRGERRENAWLATGTFQVANHAINTHFAMVWRPRVWHQLMKLAGDATDRES